MSSTVLLCRVLAARAPRETVAPLPKPSGRFAIGTTMIYLSDSTRREADLPGARPITVQLWYPTTASGPAAAYLVERGLLASMLRTGYYGVDSATLRAWGSLLTHSHVDAPPVGGTHPLVGLSVGLGVARANYTSIAEELASHGDIVALVESPLQGYMVLPNGREVIDTAGKFGDTAGHRQGVAGWTKDISFEADARVRACVDMDGGFASPNKEPLADFVARGASKPTLVLRSQPLYDDTTFARRGITREQWTKQGEAGRLALEEFVGRSSEPVRIAYVAGTGHFSFTDAPFVMPSAITRFGGRIIQPERGWVIITTAIRTFFDGEFSRTGDRLDELTRRFTEFTVDPPRGEWRWRRFGKLGSEYLL